MPATKKKEHSHEYLAKVVDELGAVKAAASDLAAKEEQLKGILIDSGFAVINGHIFRATVSDTTQTKLDQNKVKQLLGPKKFEQCKRSTPCVVVRVTSRIRES